MSNSKRWPHAKCSWPQVKVMWIASTTSCGCHLTSLSSWTAFLSGFFPKHLVKSCCWLPNATLCVGAQQKAWSMRSAGTSLCSMCAEGWRRWESEAAKKPGQIWSGFKPPENLNIIAWTTKGSQTWYLQHRRAVASIVLPQVISNLQLLRRWDLTMPMPRGNQGMARIHLKQPTEPGQLARREHWEHRDRWATGELQCHSEMKKWIDIGVDLVPSETSWESYRTS